MSKRELSADFVKEADLVANPRGDYGNSCDWSTCRVHNIGEFFAADSLSVCERTHGRANHKGICVVVKKNGAAHEHSGEPCGTCASREGFDSNNDALNTSTTRDDVHHAYERDGEKDDVDVE